MRVITPLDSMLSLQAISQSSFLAGFSEAILAEIAHGACLKEFMPGETVFWEGDPCAGLCILHTGSVKLYKLAPSGRQLIIRVIEEPGSTFNEVSVFDGGPNPVNVAALKRARIWVIEAQVVQQALQQHPEQSQMVILKLARNLRTLVNRLEELAFYQVTHRLARLLLNLPERYLSGEDEQRLTQDDLAARLGTVREVVARSLRELESSGAIRVERRRILVQDHQRLMEWAQYE